jgi:hypothetical protein
LSAAQASQFLRNMRRPWFAGFLLLGCGVADVELRSNAPAPAPEQVRAVEREAQPILVLGGGLKRDSAGDIVVNDARGRYGWYLDDTQGTVLKVDLESGEALGLYGGFQKPQATATDVQGYTWVASWGYGPQAPSIAATFATLVRIAGDRSGCVDRNGDGRIETSADTNGDGQLGLDEVVDGDECVLETVSLGAAVPAGAAPLSLTVGAGSLWLTHPYGLFELDPATGATITSYPSLFGATSVTVGGPRTVWVLFATQVVALDPVMGRSAELPPVPFAVQLRQSAVDSRGRLWVAADSMLVRYDPVAQSWLTFVQSQPCVDGLTPSFLSIDEHDGVYVGFTGLHPGGGITSTTVHATGVVTLGGSDMLLKLDSETGLAQPWATTDPCTAVRGLAGLGLGARGDVWVLDFSGTSTHYDLTTGAQVAQTVDSSGGAAGSQDFSGYTSGPARGSIWVGVRECALSSVTWSARVPEGTRVELFAYAGLKRVALQGTSPARVDLPGVDRLEIVLTASRHKVTPVFESLSLGCGPTPQ